MRKFKNKLKKYSYSVVELRKSFLDKEYFSFIVLNVFILVVIVFEFIFILNFVSEVDSDGIKLIYVKYLFSFSILFGFISIFLVFFYKKYYIYISYLFFSIVCFSHFMSGLAEKVFLVAMIIIVSDLIFRRLLNTDEYR